MAELAVELRTVGVESADVDARMLVLAAAGVGRLDLVRDPTLLLDAAGEERLARHRLRRLDREPVARILGRREFWGLELEITPSVLDPRPDTETLVEAALSYLRHAGLDRRPVHIVDLGTGSGAILIALLHALPMALGVGVDYSFAAIGVARRNALRHGLAARAIFVRGDWATAFAGPVDLLVANPPYLRTAEIGAAGPEVRCFDPPAALDGGIDGLSAYRAIVADWQRLERPPLLLEVGVTQAEAVLDLLRHSGPTLPGTACGTIRDMAGKERIVAVLPQLHFPR
jgi:release factor glutamine methyltransferase